MTVHFPFQNTYAAMPANFFARVAPTPVASPKLIKLNRPLALHLGLDPEVLASPEGVEILLAGSGVFLCRLELFPARQLSIQEYNSIRLRE